MWRTPHAHGIPGKKKGEYPTGRSNHTHRFLSGGKNRQQNRKGGFPKGQHEKTTTLPVLNWTRKKERNPEKKKKKNSGAT